MANLLVVDDHPLFRDGFAHMARLLRPHWVLGFATSARESLTQIGTSTPDLVVIDVGLPGDDGFQLAETIAARWPALPAMLISGREDAAVRVRARACGVRGFVAKTSAPDMLAASIDAVLDGREAFDQGGPADAPALTPRQAEVLMLLTEGHGNKEIRYRLGIAERTVRAHMTDLFELLGAHSRTQAIIRARELGLIA